MGHVQWVMGLWFNGSHTMSHGSVIQWTMGHGSLIQWVMYNGSWLLDSIGHLVTGNCQWPIACFGNYIRAAAVALLLSLVLQLAKWRIHMLIYCKHDNGPSFDVLWFQLAAAMTWWRQAHQWGCTVILPCGYWYATAAAHIQSSSSSAAAAAASRRTRIWWTITSNWDSVGQQRS